MYHCIVIKLLVIFCQTEQSHGYKHCSRQTIISLLKKTLCKLISCSKSILILNKSFEASLEVKGIIMVSRKQSCNLLQFRSLFYRLFKIFTHIVSLHWNSPPTSINLTYTIVDSNIGSVYNRLLVMFLI